MKQIVLIEDESLVRLGVRSLIEQKSELYQVVGEASNGNDAVDLILRIQPDIVLLDITIPGISGIEVLSRVRKQGFAGYIMILTCHEEISYAQQALRNGADEYILKSELDAKTLFSNLASAKANSASARDSRPQMHNQKENFLTNLFLVGLRDPEEFSRSMAAYHLRVRSQQLYFILVHIQNYSHVIQRYQREEQDMFFTAIDSLLSQSVIGTRQYELVRFSPEDHILLLSFEGEHSQQKIESSLSGTASRIHNNIVTFLDMDVRLAVSGQVQDVTRLNHTLEQLRGWLDRCYFYDQIVCITVPHKRDDSTFPAALAQLKTALREMTAGKCSPDISGAVQKMLETCRPNSVYMDKVSFLYCVQEYANALYDRLGEKSRSFSPELSLEQLVAHIQELESNCTAGERPQNYLALRAMEYIDQHFVQDITLEQIADHIGVSPSYLSRVFAHSVGQNISGYIMEKRVEKAKRLISTTNLKHYEIAEKCGLNSSAYFTSVFKKVTGMTPNQYRNKPEP